MDPHDPHSQDWIQALALAFLAGLALVVLGFLCGCFGSFRPSLPSQGPGLPGTELPGAPKPPGNGAQAGASDPLDDARQRVADAEGALAKARAELDQSKKQAEEKALASWQYWTRLIAALGIPLAFAAGALGAWFGLGRIALPIAGALLVFCVALLAFGEALPWLRIAGPILGGFALAGVVVALIVRQRRALAATARLGDALESGLGVAEAKLEAKGAQIAAGAWQAVQRARGRA
jgi:hypothetical protein